jgi:hypothetical protein
MTSGSPTNPPARRADRRVARRHVGRGIDRQLILARGDRALVLDAAASRDRIPDGKGTPKNRWRLTHQSPFSPFTQFS